MGTGTIPFLIELDEEAPIKSLGLLHRIPGLAKIHFNFDAFDRPKARRQKVEQLNEDTTPLLSGPKVSPSQELLKILQDAGGPMTRQAIKAAGGGGPVGERIVSNVNAMVKADKLKKVGPALYDLADRLNGSNASPSKTEVSDKKTAPGKLTGADIILGALKEANGKQLRKADFKAAFKAAGRSPGSVGDQMTKLLKEKRVRKPDRDRYELATPKA